MRTDLPHTVALLLALMLSACVADDALPPSEDSAAIMAAYPHLVPFDQLATPAVDPETADPATLARIDALKARAAALAPPILTDADRAILAPK